MFRLRPLSEIQQRPCDIPSMLFVECPFVLRSRIQFELSRVRTLNRRLRCSESTGGSGGGPYGGEVNSATEDDDQTHAEADQKEFRILSLVDVWLIGWISMCGGGARGGIRIRFHRLRRFGRVKRSTLCESGHGGMAEAM
jgi:hypothetical protein